MLLRSQSGRGGSEAAVQRPYGRPGRTHGRITRDAGRRVRSTSKGVLPGEGTASMVDLDVDKGDGVVGSEGEAPYRGIKVHRVIDADKPRLAQLLAVLWGEVCLLLMVIPFLPKP